MPSTVVTTPRGSGLYRGPLVLLRVLGATLVGLDLVSSLLSPTDPIVVHVPLSLVTAAAALLAIFGRPLTGFALSLLPLASVFAIGEYGYGVTASMFVVLVGADLLPQRPLLIVMTVYVATLATQQVLQVSDLAALGLVMLGSAAVVGWGFRLLRRRSNQAAGDIQDLRLTIEQIRADERATLAAELSAQLVEGLAGNQRVLDAAARTHDRAEAAVALDRLATTSRSALTRLRGLVTTLRTFGVATVATDAVPTLGEVLDEVEDSLVGHGYPVEVELDSALTELPPEHARLMGRALRLASEHVETYGTAGESVRIDASRSDTEAALVVTHPADVAVSASTQWRSLVEEVRADGGTCSVDTDEDRWRLRLALPVTAEVAPTNVATSRRPRPPSWWRIARPAASQVYLVLGLVCLVYFTARALSALGQGRPWIVEGLWALGSLAAVLVPRFPWLSALLLVCGLIVSLPVSNPTLREVQAPHLFWLALAAFIMSRRPRWTWWVLLGWTLYLAVWRFPTPFTAETLALSLYPLAGGCLGLTVHHFTETRRTQRAELSRLALERAEARAGERRQLAGELHDIVAHQLSLMTMQVMAIDPSADLATLQRTIRQLARTNASAQADLDTLVVLLRDDDEAASAPLVDGAWMPLTAVARAVATTLEQSGRHVRLHLDPDAGACDPTTQRTVVRCLREASTNILRYAPDDALCTLKLNATARQITLEVASTLPDVAPVDPDSTGYGLLGLAERTRLTGGTFTAGADGSVWRVRAVLPRWATDDR